MARSRPMRVPIEFEIFVNKHSKDFADQTGLPLNNTATMRRMARKLEGRLITQLDDFDFAILGRTRRRRKR